MSSTWNIGDLEIIGYTDVRDSSMLPAVLPPVFRSKSDPNSVLVTPYRLRFDTVVGATRISIAEANELHADEELTLFTTPSFPAQPDHELWMQKDGALLYEPAAEANRKLNKLCEQALARAIEALQDPTGLDRAEAAASEAALCNDHRAEPFAIKAAIRRRRNDFRGEELMTQVTESLIEPFSARLLIDGYFQLSPALLPPIRRPIPASNLSGIAAIPMAARL